MTELKLPEIVGVQHGAWRASNGSLRYRGKALIVEVTHILTKEIEHMPFTEWVALGPPVATDAPSPRKTTNLTPEQLKWSAEKAPYSTVVARKMLNQGLSQDDIVRQAYTALKDQSQNWVMIWGRMYARGYDVSMVESPEAAAMRVYRERAEKRK